MDQEAADMTRRGHGRFRRWIIRLALWAGLATAVAGGVLGLECWWIHHRYSRSMEALVDRGVPLTRGDLHARVPLPPEEENAASLLLEAAKLLSKVTGTILEQIPADAPEHADERTADSYDWEAIPVLGLTEFPEPGEVPDSRTRMAVAAFLRDHESVTRLLDRALQRSRCVFDHREKLDETMAQASQDWLKGLRTANDYLSLLVSDAAWRGDLEAFHHHLLSMAKLRYFRSNEPTTLQLVWSTVLAAGLFDQVRRSSTWLAQLTSTQVEALRKRFEDPYPGLQPLEAIQGDRVWLLGLKDLGQKDPDTSFSESANRFLLKRMLPAVLEDLETLERLAPQFPHDGDVLALLPTPKSASSRLSADFLHAATMPVINDTFLRLRQHEANHALAFTALAVLHFRAESGELPPTLIDLTPEFLPSIPLDPYGTGPVRYRRTDHGAVVYSVWFNGTDENGVSDPASFKAGDRVFPILLQ